MGSRRCVRRPCEAYELIIGQCMLIQEPLIPSAPGLGQEIQLCLCLDTLCNDIDAEVIAERDN